MILRRRGARWALGLAALAAVGAGAGWAVLTNSPTPGALLIRGELDAQSKALGRKLTAAADADPRTRDVVRLRDQPYRAGDPEALLDVYTLGTPAGQTAKARPTIVWFHGGGWLAGDKADWAGYYELLAARGFTVVSVGYALAPEHTYPRPVIEGNAALGHLRREAARLHVDPDRLVLAGDSAGAQIASQLAALTTDPAFARRLAITPSTDASALRGAVLHCGAYDTTPFVDRDVAPGGPLGFGVATLMWAYAGTKDWNSKIFSEMSTLDHVSDAFPPSLITGGNADPLTDGQSRPFAAKLRSLGVPVRTAFFAAGHTPKLEHEFQFDLAREESRAVLEQTVRFVRAQTA